MAIDLNLKDLRKKSGVRSVVIYTFTNFFGKAVSFLLLIIFTNPAFITPSENGLLTLFSNSILLLMPFLSMGIVHSAGTDYFKLSKDEFKDLFASGFVLSVTVMILSAVLLFFFRHMLRDKYGFPPLFVWLIPLMTFLVFCNDQLLSLARNKQDTGVYLRSNIARVILESGISVALVVFFAWHWQGRAVGLLAAYLIMAVYGFYYFFRNGYLPGRPGKKYICNELVYAVPIIALQLGTFCMGSSDRFFLSNFTHDKNATVGIYNVAATFGSIMIILCTASLQYLFPKIYAELAKPDIQYGGIKKNFVVYAAVMLAGMLLIMLLTPAAYHFFIDERYHAGLQYVFILCGGYFLWTIAYFFFSFLLFYKEKRKILALSCCSICISLVFNYFFIKQWAAWGAAVANICTYFVVLLLTLFFTRQYWTSFIGPKSKKNGV
jgi:O-antigen/teichoic acid export membrane protein